MNLGAERPLVVLVIDGFGIGPAGSGNAVAAAAMPAWRG